MNERDANLDKIHRLETLVALQAAVLAYLVHVSWDRVSTAAAAVGAIVLALLGLFALRQWLQQPTRKPGPPDRE